MDLFQSSPPPVQNLLPFDGEVIHHGFIYSQTEQLDLFQFLMKEIAWRHDEAIVFGKLIQTKRKVAWYGNKPYTYHYSGREKSAMPWIPCLLSIKEKIETRLNETFNSCLVNLYHHGEESVGWHSDDEKELALNGTIASLSLGATRKFCFKHKRVEEKREILLEGGSLLEMKGLTQSHWLHALPKMASVKTPRINLTFRKMNEFSALGEHSSPEQ